MKKIEHLGIAVRDIDKGIDLYEKLLGTPCYKRETVETEGVVTAFFRTGESKVELLQGLNETSPITRFIEKKGEGIHHIAFAVENIHAEIDRLKREGFELINDVPKEGADNKLIAFLHPRSTNGVLVEICMDRDDL